MQPRRAQTSHLELDLAQELPPLSEVMEQSIYRVAQELLTNVMRHAAATTLQVHLRADSRHIELLVHDDGRGFVEPMARSDQYGLRGLRERTEDLGGGLRVESGPSRGTTVSLTIPY